MGYLETIWSYCTVYYISNLLASLAYIVMKTVHPVCEWFFKEGERCVLSWADSETLIFVGIVLAFKNTKWKQDVNRDFFGMAMAFFKAVNLILFLRADWRLFIIYFVICLVLFIAVPEPLYSGPDYIQLFNGIALEEELKQNPEVTLLIEFYTVWSPPCKKLAEPFAEISMDHLQLTFHPNLPKFASSLGSSKFVLVLNYAFDWLLGTKQPIKCRVQYELRTSDDLGKKYDSTYLKFGKMDLGKNPVIGQRFNIDDSVTSRQLPTLIIFKNGKEVSRRPFKAVGRDGKVAPFHFTKENLISAFELKSCLESAKDKLEREEKKVRNEEKKKQ